MPVYNVEEYLEECLDSVVNQTLKDIEIICVNDGSTDNSLDILKGYAQKDNRIIILDEINEGAGISRKKGLNISKGEYVAFVDADDILNLRYLELAYKNGITNDSELVFFKVKLFDTNVNWEGIHEKFDLSQFFPKNKDFTNFTFNWRDVKPIVFNKFTNIWNCLFKGDFLRKNDFYFPKKLSFNDVPLHVQSIIYANRISFVPEVLYDYRMFNKNSITINTHTNNNVFDFFKIISFLKIFLIKNKLDDELKLEFIHFILDHGTYHLNRIDNYDIKECFFEKLKSELLNYNITVNEIDTFPKNIINNYYSIINSSLCSEFKIRQEIYSNQKPQYNSNDIKVSVVVPVYNVEEYLEECLDSVVNQTLKDIEIICVNDGSTDNSLDILKKYAQNDNRIKIINQKNRGLGATRKVGLDNASGEYITFIDSDDFYELNALELLYNNALSNNTEVVLFKLIDFYEEKDIKYFSYPRYNIDKHYNEDFSNFSFDYHYLNEDLFFNSFSACLKLYNRNFLNKYDFSFLEHTRYEDIPLHIEVLLRAKLSFCPYYLYNYRRDNALSIMNNSEDEKTKDIFKVIDIVENFLVKEGYYEEFKNDFEKFKVIQISQYVIPSNSKSYFLEAKKRLENIEINFYLNDKIKTIYESVLSSNSIQEVKQKFESNFFEHKPKVSVIVPVYNVENYLKECLDSILNQTFDDIEIICINDGSTDYSLKILLDYIKQDHRLKVYSQCNKGLGSTRNVGLTLASGEYIYFMDSDDFLELNALELLYNNAISNDSDCVFLKVIEYDDNLKVKNYSKPGISLENHFDVDFDNFTFTYSDVPSYIFHRSFAVHLKMYKSQFLKSYDDFFFLEKLRYQDVPFHIQVMLRAKRISFCPHYLLNYRVSNDNSITINPQKHAKDIYEIIDIVEDFLKKENIFKKFEGDFYKFKVVQISQKILSSNSNEFFLKAKKEFENIDFTKFWIDEHFKTIVSLTLDCVSFQYFKEKYNNYLLKNQNKPKVSVIVPVYNVEDYLEECLNSLLSQTLDEIEIICIDDGSTDNSLNILKEFQKKDNKIKTFSKSNSGSGNTRNVGLEYVNGEYVSFIDSDDFIRQDTYETTYKLAKEKDLDMVMFKAINFDDNVYEFYETEYYNMSFLDDLVKNKIFNYNDLEDNLLSLAVSPCTKIYKKELIDKTGVKFPEDLYFEDNVFFFDLFLQSSRVFFYPEFLYMRRHRINSITKSGGIKYIDIIQITNNVIDIFKKFNLYERYERRLINFKISSIFLWFNKTKEEFRELFFNEIKADLTKVKEDEELYAFYQENLWNDNKVNFDKIFDVKNYNEFKSSELNNNVLSLNQVDEQACIDHVNLNRRYKDKIKYLEYSNKLLRKELNDLKQGNRFLKNIKIILNSFFSK